MMASHSRSAPSFSSTSVTIVVMSAPPFPLKGEFGIEVDEPFGHPKPGHEFDMGRNVFPVPRLVVGGDLGSLGNLRQTRFAIADLHQGVFAQSKCLLAEAQETRGNLDSAGGDIDLSHCSLD